MSLFGFALGAGTTWAAALYAEVHLSVSSACLAVYDVRMWVVLRRQGPVLPGQVVLNMLIGLQREVFRSARETSAQLNGTIIVSRVPRQLLEEEIAFAKHMGLHAVAALASTWNQSVDAVFQPVISELQKRGW